MIYYTGIYLTLSLVVLCNINFDRFSKFIFWMFFAVFMIIFIGFRHEVGGDFDIYERGFRKNAEHFNFVNFNIRSDYGYEFLNYIIYKIGLSFHYVNFICASLFIYGIVKFCRLQINPLLSFVISFPYIILIVGMGYTRQAVAFSFLLLSIIALDDDEDIKFFIFILLAVLFHKSAVIFAVFIILKKQIRLTDVLKAFVLIVSVYFIFKKDIDRSIYFYIGEGIHLNSRGAFSRLLLNLSTGLIFFFIARNKITSILYRNIYTVLSLTMILMLFFIEKYSTIIDRYVIYFSFMQMTLFPYLTVIFQRKYNNLMTFIILGLYFGYLLYMINFLDHFHLWVEYSNLFFL